MKSNNSLLTFLGLLLFFSGILISLVLSLMILWGEIEAGLFMPQVGNEKLEIDCPLMIAPWETAVISTTITNTLVYDETKPQVILSIRREKDVRSVSETLNLSSRQQRSIQWTADRSDIIFKRLILVDVFQRPYSDLPSRQGTCSILVFSFLGLNGINTLQALVSAGVLASLLGAGLLYFLYRPATEFAQNIMQLNGLFLFLVLAGLITALTRHSGLTLMVDAFAFLVFTTGNVEIFMPHKK